MKEDGLGGEFPGGASGRDNGNPWKALSEGRRDKRGSTVVNRYVSQEGAKGPGLDTGDNGSRGEEGGDPPHEDGSP